MSTARCSAKIAQLCERTSDSSLLASVLAKRACMSRLLMGSSRHGNAAEALRVVALCMRGHVKGM